VIFFGLKPFEERKSKDLKSNAILMALNQKFSTIQEGFVAVFPPPAVNGLGSIGGFKMMIEDRAGLGDSTLYANTQALIGRVFQTPGLGGAFSGFQINVPQLFADVDRDKVKQLGIPLNNVFSTLQIYLGSQYVNDFNKFGRTYQVIAQADAPYRANADNIGQLKVRNVRGDMVPLGSVLTMKQSYGPDQVTHYNGYPAADISGSAAPGTSAGAAVQIMERLANETLPNGMGYEWTELTYQQKLAGNTAILVFPLCILLVFLVLAAQYESLRLPLAIILIVPMCLLCGIAGVMLRGMDNNIFTQIGFVVLVGLASKNAILIVEFAKVQSEAGVPRRQATLDAVRLRLRPILMTSFAFILGVVPLVIASGAGSEMRRTLGIAVFSGMLGVTLFGVFLTPIFFYVIQGFNERRATSHNNDQAKPTALQPGESEIPHA
jgi:multidrug efflux pump